MWINKYQPKNLSQIRGQDSNIIKLKEFVTSFKKGKALLLYGLSGVGKTASVYALARELDKELIEINASDFRNKDQINLVLTNSIQQQSLFFKQKIILIDEIDGISGTKDRGGIAEIIKVIKESKFPVIITANDPYIQSISSLRRYCNLVEFKKLNYLTLNNILKDILTKENIRFDEKQIKLLAQRSGGDVRAAIIDLQSLYDGNNLLSLDHLDERDYKETIFNGMMLVLKSKDPNNLLELFDKLSLTFEDFTYWLEENLPVEYTKSDDLERAFEMLSRADVFKGRIMRWQHWRFMVYMLNLSTVGVALAKKEKYSGFPRFKPPTRLLSYWQLNRSLTYKNSIAEKLASQTMDSKAKIMQNFYLYKNVYTNQMGEELKLSLEEIKYITK